MFLSPPPPDDCGARERWSIPEDYGHTEMYLALRACERLNLSPRELRGLPVREYMECIAYAVVRGQEESRERERAGYPMMMS
jgi:hypothetical protein